MLNDDEEGDGGGRWCVQEGPALDVLDAYGEAHDRRLFITDEDESIMAPLKQYLESTGSQIPDKLARHPAASGSMHGDFIR